MKKILIIFCLCFVLQTFTETLFPQAIDLVKLRKKEQERRKKQKKAKYSLTSKNINQVSTKGKKAYSLISIMTDYIPSSTAQSTQGDVKGSAKEGKDSKKDPKKDREYWQKKINDLRTLVNNLKKSINSREAKLDQLVRNYHILDMATERQQLDDDITKLEGIIKDEKARLQKLQARLDAIPDEARRAGVPPGWIR